MSEALQLMASSAAGILLGLVFFWGLWMTLNHLGRSRHPALRMLVSLLLRFVLVSALFYLLAHERGWEHLLAAAAGFTLVRIVIFQRLRPRNSRP